MGAASPVAASIGLSHAAAAVRLGQIRRFRPWSSVALDRTRVRVAPAGAAHDAWVAPRFMCTHA